MECSLISESKSIQLTIKDDTCVIHVLHEQDELVSTSYCKHTHLNQVLEQYICFAHSVLRIETVHA